MSSLFICINQNAQKTNMPFENIITNVSDGPPAHACRVEQGSIH